MNNSSRLTPADPFGREWIDPAGSTLVRSEVWAASSGRHSDSRGDGTRLLANTQLVQQVLKARASDLLLLVILRRHEQGFGLENSKFWHTTAVARVTPALKLELYPGRINALHKSRY